MVSVFISLGVETTSWDMKLSTVPANVILLCSVEFPTPGI